MANTNNTRRSFTDLTEPQQIRELNRQMEWVWHQLLGGLTEKALSKVGIQQTVRRIESTVANELTVTTLDATEISAAIAAFLVANVTVLSADLANLNDLQAAMATLSNACIKNADIDIAKLKRMSTDTAFIREQIGGKVFIDDLAVSDANIVNLAAGTLMIRNSNGDMVELYVDAQGQIQARNVSFDGNDIVSANSLNGNRIIQNTITADRLDATQIFALNSTIMNLIADHINASRITVGYLSASKIKGDQLTLGGSNNTNGILVLLDAYGTEIMKLYNGGMALHKGNIDLGYDSSIKIGFDASNSKYARFDHNGMMIVPSSGSSITTETIVYAPGSVFPSDVDMSGLINKYEYGSTSISSWMTPGSLQLLYNTSSGDSYITLSMDRGLDMYFSQGSTYFNPRTGSNGIHGDLTIDGGLTVYEDLTAYGSKSRAVSTDQYSDRLLYCYETPSPLFGDVGEGLIGEDGKCYVWLDAIFAETITTTQYQVFLQAYGDGKCYVAERQGNCFVVKGTPGLAFGWEIKAKQKGYDQKRLDNAGRLYTPQDHDYGNDAVAHIDKLMKERVQV